MITLYDKVTKNPTRHYECTPRQMRELCFANIVCLLHIALADSDEHIRQLGGEQTLLDLMNGYEELAKKFLAWEEILEEREGGD